MIADREKLGNPGSVIYVWDSQTLKHPAMEEEYNLYDTTRDHVLLKYVKCKSSILAENENPCKFRTLLCLQKKASFTSLGVLHLNNKPNIKQP